MRGRAVGQPIVHLRTLVLYAARSHTSQLFSVVRFIRACPAEKRMGNRIAEQITQRADTERFEQRPPVRCKVVYNWSV